MNLVWVHRRGVGKLEAAPPLWLYALAMYLIGTAFHSSATPSRSHASGGQAFSARPYGASNGHSADQVCAGPEARQQQPGFLTSLLKAARI